MIQSSTILKSPFIKNDSRILLFAGGGWRICSNRSFRKVPHDMESAPLTMKVSNESIYGTLSESQMATYESVTCALEHTELIDGSGNSFGNALQQVASVTGIAGEISGAGGDKQFRLFATMTPGGIDNSGNSQGFSVSSNAKNFLFFSIQPYHKGFPNSYRQERSSGVTGMEAGLQPSYSKDKF